MRRDTPDLRGPATRRQWGSDRRREPLPLVPPRVSDGRMAIGRMAIVLTVTTWAVYVAFTIEQQFIEGKADSARLVIEAIVYLLLVTGLATSAMAYLITRIGFFYRSRAHTRAPRVVLDAFFDSPAAPMTVLVPSYQEDERVIRTTLLSAALQEYPELDVVLLIDDPQDPTTARARSLLADARALPGIIERELAVPASRFRAARDAFRRAVDDGSGRAATTEDIRELAGHYRFAVEWLHDLAARHVVIDHTDVFFTEHVLGALAADLATVGEALAAGAEEGIVLPAERLQQLHRRLVSTFSARVTSFERKRYRSLSHEPNKAMNLNSYMGLMGGSFQEVETPMGRALVPSSVRAADLVVADPAFVLTLDADSMLLPEYAARMVHLLEQSAHARVAVAQTPYSSFPGAATRLERISGASTDLQHIVHQGMTQYDATFWVGANAVLRKKALDDIVEIDYDGDFEIRRYIQDRTVIEDTESTIDLGVHGWELVNYPERLAYSATPPDFGSLCIQRQRWANGGLLILPKLREQVRARRARGERNRFGELFLRVNYMASIAWSSVCLLTMLVYPFNSALLNPLLLLVSIPYFLVMAGDLRATGYRRTDVLRIYGFNLVLLPVNLSGSFASVLQLITGEKSAFKRTPKIRDRTTAGAVFILAPLALIGLCVYAVVVDIQGQRWSHLVFALLNGVLTSYAMIAFVGLGNSAVDLWVHLRDWLFPPVDAQRARRTRRARRSSGRRAAVVSGAAAPAPAPDWASVLQYGLPGTGTGTGTGTGDGDGAAATPAVGQHRAAAALPARDDSAVVATFRDFIFFTVFQPIVDLADGEPVGYEALCRFADGRSPQDRLDAATYRGVGVDLDGAMMRASLAAAASLPEGAWVSVNVSGALWDARRMLFSILGQATAPVVLESGPWAEGRGLAPADVPVGVRAALEDPLVGYGSFSAIEEHRPAFLKLGRETTAGIEDDAARRALLSALVSFAEERGCQVIASGVETESERDALRSCGVPLGQGYFLGLPAPAPSGNRPVVEATPAGG
ncbi:glycosyltransferase family 2 protein [Trujillonella endophytica]|uniref:EAL domain, c-di-GMP-specific phosphodiesterase class I (Or its enzymatically inactive variant) n=1 Tax=Trujillonella endophytica TaxID=673521 RepID=A0A1H8UDR9_9ACTN|nr:glycosyltransferase family 2 protein [Trujillella endophytica]SEP01246.1 EAL domain, c-di-GMP-specific phosphodiesterase class I (or its enzymatically inactive variant) [Trujillella endophytica]